MFFWRADKLARRLRTHMVPPLDITIYMYIGMLQYITGVTVFSWIPYVYRAIFLYLSKHITQEIQQPTVQLLVYTTWDHWLPLITYLGILCIFICLYIGYGRRSLHTFTERFVCLNLPVSIRIITIVSSIFLLALAFALVFFGSQLMMLTQPPEARGILNSFLRMMNKINVIGKVWSGYTKLQQAEIIFEQINECSLYFYWVSYLLSVYASVWYFFTMKKYLSRSKIQ